MNNRTPTSSNSLIESAKKPLLILYVISVMVVIALAIWAYTIGRSHAQLQSEKIATQLQSLIEEQSYPLDEQVMGEFKQRYSSFAHIDITGINQKDQAIVHNDNEITLAVSDTHKLFNSDGQQVAIAFIQTHDGLSAKLIVWLSAASVILLTALVGMILYSWRRQKARFFQNIEPIERVLEQHQKSDRVLVVAETGPSELIGLKQSINKLGTHLQNAKDKLDHQVSSAYHEINQTLEELEIKNVELDLARKRAEESNEAKSSFLANISHEIRTPMHGIIGHLQLLQRMPLSSQPAEYVRRTLESSNGLLNIIDDILNLSRIESDRLDIQNAPFNLVEDVNRGLIMQVPDAIKKGLDIYFLCDPTIECNYIGDGLRIRQVFTNLLSNAIKYTERGSIKVRLKITDKKSGKRDTVQLQVSDTGLGMDSEQIESLFQAFSQAGRSPESGTGLGLLITKTLTEAMGGRLQLESEVGRGSTFTMTLPLTRGAENISQPFIAPRAGRVAVECDDAEVSRHYERIIVDAHLHVHRDEHSEADVNLIVLTQSKIRAMENEGIELTDVCAQRKDKHLILMNSLNLNLMSQINEHQHCYALPLTSDKLAVQATLVRLLQNAPLEEFDDAQVRVKENTNQTHQSQFDSANLEGVRILLADDDKFGRRYMTQLLSEHGALITDCADGVTAIESAKSSQFDLIILDIRMPGCNGIKATEEIRKFEHMRQTPIIGMTASVVPEQHQQCVQAGMTDYWTKPLRVPQLMSGLGHWLSTMDSTVNKTTSDHGSIGIEDAISQLDNEMRNILFIELQNALDQLQKFDPAYDEITDIREMAHVLSGSAAICKLDQLRESAAKLQKNTRKKDPDSIPTLIQSLKDQILRVKNVIEGMASPTP